MLPAKRLYDARAASERFSVDHHRDRDHQGLPGAIIEDYQLDSRAEYRSHVRGSLVK